MARLLRIEFPGAPYHVTACQDIFLNDEDRQFFLFVLAHVERGSRGSNFAKIGERNESVRYFFWKSHSPC